MSLALRTQIAGLGAALFLVAPVPALACAVCTTGSDEANRLAFILTTVFLSVLPLLMLGAVLAWLWRSARQLGTDPTTRLHGSPLAREEPAAPPASAESAVTRA